ncbi:uncharacterized protein K452DRAFT_108801 [Aplosporella prunicola CBS 121167]|uniref:Uncharacterized protein n=1 Tax=Aplosporella prunicola CBS 121167 TaxID=1176127 RepID=A0A6A6BUH1_9PEZI|nr:uncharacterized protein K452DRAFT_108801 [Aplosporella prunicola CBS 121167]KAF2146301.1 hypothetical protein K452DRAFT_108801 [Aplosporella prunicola CBS 121167]
MRAPIALALLGSAGFTASAAVIKPPQSNDSPTDIPAPTPINSTDDPRITSNPRITDKPAVLTTSSNIVWDFFPTDGILSLFTPMPLAVPTPVRSQSQVETTYIPRYTLCRGGNGSGGSSTAVASAAADATADEDCRTYYEASLTTLCATTLTGLGTRVPITACDQDVTFSSDFGAVLVPATHHRTQSGGEEPAVTVAEVVGGSSSTSTSTSKTKTKDAAARTTPAPSSTLQLRTTYYLAPWQQLTAGGDVPADVDVKVCHVRAGNDSVEDCVRAAEAWAVVPVTLTSAITSTVDVVASVTGAGRFLVETYHRPIVANATVVSLSTEMVVNYAYMAETISRSQKVTSTSSGTLTRTRTVKVANVADEEEAE